LENNEKREFGLTSWALVTDTLFPTDIPALPIAQGGGVDWSQLGWDHENAMSAHKDSGEKKKLWPKPLHGSWTILHVQYA